jgi:hypothetical protein
MAGHVRITREIIGFAGSRQAGKSIYYSKAAGFRGLLMSTRLVG